MLIQAQNAITKISDNEMYNKQNYMESLSYIGNLYSFLNITKNILNMNEITFLPSFKGKYISEVIGIPSTAEENEMKVFKIACKKFSEDEERRRVSYQMAEFCHDIMFSGEFATFIIK